MLQWYGRDRAVVGYGCSNLNENRTKPLANCRALTTESSPAYTYLYLQHVLRPQSYHSLLASATWVVAVVCHLLNFKAVLASVLGKLSFFALPHLPAVLLRVS